MSQIKNELEAIRSLLGDGQRLVAVSKFHPADSIREAYSAGQRIFGESHVQELIAKQPVLPDDIEWHFIGHLQTNKVKYIAPFVSMIHAVDSMRLLEEINRQGNKVSRRIKCLIELHIAQEETKYGFSMDEAEMLLKTLDTNEFKNISICGLMCMASNTDDMEQVRKEFRNVSDFFSHLKKEYQNKFPEFCELSMGMSNDFKIALEEGSTMVRVGSLIFGQRVY